MDIPRAALSFVAKRSGKTLPEATWAHVISLELQWLPPGEARAFVASAKQAGLLVEAEGGLSLGFPPVDEALPRKFTLEPVEGGAEDDPFMDWVQRTATAKGISVSDVLNLVAEKADHLDAFTAVLALAHEAGLDVQQAAADALKE